MLSSEDMSSVYSASVDSLEKNSDASKKNRTGLTIDPTTKRSASGTDPLRELQASPDLLRLAQQWW